jgi:hypothetical protein
VSDCNTNCKTFEEHCFLSKKIKLVQKQMAEGVGFEPTVGLRPRRFSRPLP